MSILSVVLFYETEKVKSFRSVDCNDLKVLSSPQLPAMFHFGKKKKNSTKNSINIFFLSLAI